MRFRSLNASDRQYRIDAFGEMICVNFNDCTLYGVNTSKEKAKYGEKKCL
jgi:hypothetical protein